jgi:hypothetical protein
MGESCLERQAPIELSNSRRIGANQQVSLCVVSAQAGTQSPKPVVDKTAARASHNMDILGYGSRLARSLPSGGASRRPVGLAGDDGESDSNFKQPNAKLFKIVIAGQRLVRMQNLDVVPANAGTYTPRLRVLARWLTASAPTNDKRRPCESRDPYAAAVRLSVGASRLCNN